MLFLQPYLLWGMLAAAIPVATHFWYQKRGKTIEWAAMRWLGGQTTLQHRGFRLNEVLLMLLRCLLAVLLAFILSKPVANWFKKEPHSQVVHLVQPDRLVTDTYRFELEEALRHGENVYWLGASPEPVHDIASMPGPVGGLSLLQQHINALAGGSAGNFKLYFRNDVTADAFPKVYIPGDYQLFPAADSSAGKQIDLLKGDINRKDTIYVLLENGDPAERRTIKAALAALTEVYGFPFDIEPKMSAGKRYDWIFTNQSPQQAKPETKYVVSGNAWKWNAPGNVIQMRDTLRLADSELVESGRFPEWLGELLVKELGLAVAGAPLTKDQLNAFFVKTGGNVAQREFTLRPWLLLGFIALLTAERWLALRKTVGSNG